MIDNTIANETFIRYYGQVGEKLDEDTWLSWLNIWQTAWHEANNQAAIYIDGKPQNLEAAANDALDWLKFWQQFMQKTPLHNAGKYDWRLSRCIKALKRFLPKEPFVFKESPRPPLYNAIAEIIVSSRQK